MRTFVWDDLRPPQSSADSGLLLTLKSSLKDFYCSQHEEEEVVENGQQLGLGRSELDPRDPLLLGEVARLPDEVEPAHALEPLLRPPPVLRFEALRLRVGGRRVIF